MRGRSYRMTSDSGFAPCPFETVRDLLHSFDGTISASKMLTQANCFASGRSTTVVGDWILGFASDKLLKKHGLKMEGMEYLLWIGCVSKIITKAEYWILLHQNPVYDPNLRPDNIYVPRDFRPIDERTSVEACKNPDYRIIKNPFHFNWGEQIQRDIGTYRGSKNDRVLICDEYYYFGEEMPPLAASVADHLTRRGLGVHNIDGEQGINALNTLIASVRRKYRRRRIIGKPLSLSEELTQTRHPEFYKARRSHPDCGKKRIDYIRLFIRNHRLFDSIRMWGGENGEAASDCDDTSITCRSTPSRSSRCQ